MAARELASGRMVADPFAATAEIVPLLELRAAQAGAEPRRRRFSSLRLHGAPARRAA
ncbi:MAG TPA: hypothetical protein VNT32_07800 [Thermoleophilaceae bacterium]|nr:hypothetical protein [Thermoleophilaceae bacterium]